MTVTYFSKANALFAGIYFKTPNFEISTQPMLITRHGRLTHTEWRYKDTHTFICRILYENSKKRLA